LQMAAKAHDLVEGARMGPWQNNNNQKFMRQKFRPDGISNHITMGEFEHHEDMKVRFMVPNTGHRTPLFIRTYVRDYLPEVGQKFLDWVYPYAKKPDFVPGPDNKKGDMYREFVIYRGMENREIRTMVAKVYWEFDTNWDGSDDSPAYFTDPNGTNYPFSLLSVKPEMFGEMTKQGIVFNLPYSKLHWFAFDFRCSTLQRWFHKEAREQWFLMLLLGCLAVELVRVMSSYFPGMGPDGLFGAVVAWFLYRADFMTTYLFTTPLKHLYRNGPAFRTPFGDLGFWGGKDISVACAFWSGSDEVKAAGLWRKPELTEVCQTLFDDKADQFAQCCTYMLYCWVFYMSVWPILKAKFGCSAGVNAGVNAGVKL